MAPPFRRTCSQRVNPCPSPSWNGPETASFSSDYDLNEVYRRHGYDAGYHQALVDLHRSLVVHAEAHLLSGGGGAEQRKQLYAFVARLQRALLAGSPLIGAGPDALTVSHHTTLLSDGAGI